MGKIEVEDGGILVAEKEEALASVKVLILILIRKCLMRGSHKFVTLMVKLVIIASFALSKFMRKQPVKMILSIATMVAHGSLIQVKLSFRDRRLN